MKERQGTSHQKGIPLLSKQDGTAVTSSREKADTGRSLLTKPPPPLEQECEQLITTVEVTQEHVECVMRVVNVKKATEPYDVGQQVLQHCATKLAGPLSDVFAACVRENTWPTIWREVCMVLVHKKDFRSDSVN